MHSNYRKRSEPVFSHTSEELLISQQNFRLSHLTSGYKKGVPIDVILDIVDTIANGINSKWCVWNGTYSVKDDLLKCSNLYMQILTPFLSNNREHERQPSKKPVLTTGQKAEA